MKSKKFTLEDLKPENELFHVNESYFEKLPVSLSEKIHSDQNLLHRPKFGFLPAVGFGVGVIVILTLSILFLINNKTNDFDNNSALIGKTNLNSHDIFQIMLHDEEFEPTEDDLVEQLAIIEDQSEERAIEEFLNDDDFLNDEILFDEI